MRNIIVAGLIVLAVLALVAWTGVGQARRRNRIAYEYRVMDDPAFATNFEEGLKQLNRLGAEGWELAGVSPNPNNPAKLYLKRVK